MKKLTEDWKIKKKLPQNKSFKEALDVSLASPENLKNMTKKKKSWTKNNISSKNWETPRNHESFLRRSQRLKQKCVSAHEVQEESFNQIELLQAVEMSSEEKQEISNNVKGNVLTVDEDNFSLSKWGLPLAVVEAYQTKNIVKMFRWQYECLSTGNVLDGGNLVFSAPTSAGKTLVAEILMLKKVTETRKKAIMILPFVSVVREKVHHLQEMFQNAGIVVDGYMGSHNPPGGFKAVDIAICTMEKANNLINRLMEEKRLHELGILVVDELHMLGDHSRGYLLELLLTKLLFNCKKNNICIQIIGMSATLPNLNVLAFWLSSELYTTDFRPVPLQERFKLGNTVYDTKTLEPFRDMSKISFNFADDSDHTIYLAIETITAGHGVLIFCPSKNWCENLATSIAKEIYNVGRPNAESKGNLQKQTIGEKLREHLKGSLLNDILQQLKNSSAGLDSVLRLTVPFGVAYHHAGLTFDERDIIEGGFKQGILKVLVATSTLSSGVNLPARRVIIRSPLFCGSAIDVLSYKQMVGRAGRKGIDDEGESILLCKETEKNIALSLVTCDLKPVKSCLLLSGKSTLHSSLKRALIEVIASGTASTREEVLQYASCTLLYASMAKQNSLIDENTVESSIDSCLNYLVGSDIIFKHEKKCEGDSIIVIYKPSQLGLAMLASGFSPDDALRILKELQLARRNFVLENDLHILYEVTPPYLSDQMGSLNWMQFLSLWEDLPEEFKRVGSLVGVQESFIGLGVQGRINKSSHKQIQKIAIHQRFYAALALNDLIQEVPLSVVSEKYNCSRGILQSLQQTTATFAGMLTIFCNRLKWHNLELLFSNFQRRVNFGVQQELCDLIRLSTLNAQRARALYNAGYESIASLANATQEDLTLLLQNMGSFESAKQLEGVLAEEALNRYEAKRIRITGKQGVDEKEAAALIIQEAQYFIKQELGISGINWSNKTNKNVFQDSIKKSVYEPSSDGTNLSSKYSPEICQNKSVLSSTCLRNSNENNDSCVIQVETTYLVKEDGSKNKNTPSQNVSSLKIQSLTEEKINSYILDDMQQNSDFDFQKNFPNVDDIKEQLSTSKTVSKKEMDSKRVCSSNNMTEFVNKEEDVLYDNVSFSEMLLSQTAEIGDVYFAQVSNLSIKLENCEDQNNLFHQDSIKGDRSGHSSINDFDKGDLKKASIKNISDDSQFKNCKKYADSFLKVFENSCMEESFSFKFQNCSKESLCYSSDKNNDGDALKRKSSDSKSDSFTLLKNNIQTHSTPKRDLECVDNISLVPKLSDIYVQQDLLSSDKSFSMEKKLLKTSFIKSTNVSFPDEKELSANETSGDIFETNESCSSKVEVDHQKNKIECDNVDKLVANNKEKSETSSDLFDDDSINNALNFVSNIEDILIPQDNKETLCSLKNQSLAHLDVQNTKLSNQLESISSSVELNKSLNRKTANISNLSPKKCKNSGKCNQISVFSQTNCFLNSGQSQFWKSWGSSPDKSDFFGHVTDLHSNSKSIQNKGLNLNVDSKEIFQNISLALDSDDNSLYKSLDIEYLSKSPKEKNMENEVASCSEAQLDQSNCFPKKPKLSQNVNDLSFSPNKHNISLPEEYSKKYPKVEIIDVLDSDLVSFLKKLSESPSFSLSVACEKLIEKRKTIGPPKTSGIKASLETNSCFIDPDIIVKGISISCGGASFYISFSQTGKKEEFNLKNKMKIIQQFFHSYLQRGIVIVNCLISQYKMLWQGCNICLKNRYDVLYFDPSIAAWLLDPSAGLQPLEQLIQNYWPEENKTEDISEFGLGIHYWSPISGKERASSEASVVFHLIPKLINDLKQRRLYDCFLEIEMPSMLAFAKMEQNGLGFNNELAITYLQDLQRKQKEVLEKSYHMAGRKFNISSSKAISRILYKELKLNNNVSPKSPKIHQYLAIGGASRNRRLPPELKTNKECLEKIIHLHPLPKAILDYRRLSFATTKVLMPLLRKNKFDSYFQMNRLYSNCYVYTLTGRIHMYSPNLQFVPRNFNVVCEQISDDMKVDEDEQCCDEDIAQYGVSLRNLFIPSKGSILLAADYSQLELRILAHLSGEKNLLDSLNSDEDVFKKISSVWKKIPVSSVSNEAREQAKRICYGMIYGMSAKTLSQQLKCNEIEAVSFVETFKSSYPGVDAYFQSVIKHCTKNGYVTTITHRKRYLPLIKSTNKSERSHAERQAINTTIQGSAADLIKAAMVKIEREMYSKFPEILTPYSSVRDLNSSKQKEESNKFKGGFLVLQMHDELIYEVNEKDLVAVANIVKKGMEETTKLSVELPVKIRIGSSWGSMNDFS